MGRPLRIDPTGGWHHVMNRGVDRQTIYRDDEDRLEFGRLLAEVSSEHDLEIHAYCLMGNHFHLLVRSPNSDMSAAMRWLQSAYAIRFNRRHDRTGHLFGDRFTSRFLTTYPYIVNVWKYIHRNPIDVVGVDSLIAYRWSSLRTYLGLRPTPEWLHLDPLRRWIGDIDAFRLDTSKQTTSSDLLHEGDADDVVAAVDFVLEAHSEQSHGHRRAERRALLLDIADTVGGRFAAELHELLGIQNPNSLNSAKTRARRHVASNHLIDAHRRHVIELLAPSGDAAAA